LKIVVVSTEYGQGNSGGVESVVDFVVASIRRLSDWDVEVVSLRMSRRAVESRRLLDIRSWGGVRRVTSTTVAGVRVHQVGSAWAEIERTRFLPRPWLDPLLKDADVILVVAGTPAVCNAVRGAKAAKILQVATLVSLERAAQNSRLRGLAGIYRRVTTWLTGRLDEQGLRVPDRILVENELMLRECHDRGIAQVDLCPPGVDATLFHPDMSVVARRPFVLMVARLGDQRKNVGGLIRAFAHARAEHGVTHNLVLAGLSRPSDEDLKLISDLNLQSVVEIHSPVSRDDLVRLYQGADVFASLSFEEGLGLTFLEAMACAVPVVTTDTAGATFVLNGTDAGAIVSHGEQLTERFAEELARWCHDPGLRNHAGAAARVRVEEEFSDVVSSRRFIDAMVLTRAAR
jgi:glycosyltransferase involved in cell wall biosynthesis